MRAHWVAFAALLAGCASGGGSGRDGGPAAVPMDGGGAADAGSTDAGGGGDAGIGTDAGPGSDSGPGVDAGGLTDAGTGTGLHPDLDVPPSGETCTYPGGTFECPGFQVCRYYSPTEGRCEDGGDVTINRACTASADCDVLFTCFQDHCVGFCALGLSECGSVAECIDIGFPERGVCAPR